MKHVGCLAGHRLALHTEDTHRYVGETLPTNFPPGRGSLRQYLKVKQALFFRKPISDYYVFRGNNISKSIARTTKRIKKTPEPDCWRPRG